MPVSALHPHRLIVCPLKVHLILRHKSPLDGVIEEKHLKFPPAVLTDTDTHVYTAILHANNTCVSLYAADEDCMLLTLKSFHTRPSNFVDFQYRNAHYYAYIWCKGLLYRESHPLLSEVLYPQFGMGQQCAT